MINKGNKQRKSEESFQKNMATLYQYANYLKINFPDHNLAVEP